MSTNIDQGLMRDACGYYPLRAEHAHFICPCCKYETKHL